MNFISNIYKKSIELAGNTYRFFFRPNVTMSNSRLNMYSTCPLKYKFAYEEGLKGFPSGHLHFGSTIHDALFEFHSKFDLRGNQGTFDDLMREYEKVWEENKEYMMESVSGPPVHRWKVALAEAKLSKEETAATIEKLKTIYNSAEEEEEFKKRGVKMLEEYFKDNQTNPNKIVALEKPLTITRRGIDILGYVDRIEKTPEGELEIVDYKTGKRTQDEEAIMLGGDTQAMIYTMMFEKKWKKKLRNFYFYYLSNRTKVPCNPQKRLIKQTFEDMEETVQNIKFERFDFSQGPLCGWCDYEIVCPAWKGLQAPYRGIFRNARERGRMTFSYSKMGSYKNCPHNYRKLYIDKVSPKPKHFFAIGHSCHETFEEFFIHPYQSSKKQLRIMFEDNWHSEGYRSNEEEAKYKKEGWEWCSNYYDKFIDGQYVPAYSVELYFQLPIGNDYVIIGYIDRLEKRADGSYHILDYKTDPKRRSQEAVDGDLQLTSYYWALKQLGIEVESLSLEFLKFSERITSTRTEEDIPDFIDEVNKTVGTMAEKEEELKKYDNYPAAEREKKAVELFPPTWNKYCGGCDHLIGCPMEQEIRTKHKDKIMNLQENEPMPEPGGTEETEEDKHER
ncbi:MAG: PD-(D/E)XK nuclease family protein [Elusimicrobia bacterium]|jgi:RecB family exonuclease|nr:PD-(D/E)XK nuclease family protein [Elusimicrobiota bacterium]